MATRYRYDCVVVLCQPVLIAVEAAAMIKSGFFVFYAERTESRRFEFGIGVEEMAKPDNRMDSGSLPTHGLRTQMSSPRPLFCPLK